MARQSDGQENLLAALGDDTSDAERAEALTAVLYRHIAEEQAAGHDIPLPAEGLEALRQYLKDPSPDVRVVVVDYLSDSGPCSWDDLEEWVQDSDRIVRDTAVSRMETTDRAAGRLCESDKAHCVELLRTVGEKFGDYQVGITLCWLAQRDDEWFGLTWNAVDKLLDQGKPDLSEMLVTCYLEHVIPERRLGPDDPRLRDWVRGEDVARKRILLRIANYWGTEEGRLGEIVEALVSDPDTSIATIAEGVREGRIEPGALWLIGDVGADEQMALEEDDYEEEDKSEEE